ncbi:MAG TPA: NAD(+)/NADH kinase [Myxococcota bacterium]|nr:NAD(+)/NADH kinase [Myxococcota bacterium]
MGGWKRIALTVKAGRAEAGPLVSRLVAMLRKRGLDVALDAHAASHLGEPGGHSLDELAALADLLVVLGGDGSVLAAVRAIAGRRVAVLGVNLGHLGFLTDVSHSEAEAALDATLRGDFALVERSRFEVTHSRDDRELLRELVLNDAVITKGSALARLIELEAFVDDRLIATYRSDGLIVATPTGSTAYNLSAGGPILDTDVRAAILNPICPHTLTLRPLVLPDDREIVVRLRSPEDATLTLDGQVGATVRTGDAVRVVLAKEPVRFVSTPARDHFETLRTKLGWGTR